MTPEEEKLWQETHQGLSEEMKKEAARSLQVQKGIDQRFHEMLHRIYKSLQCAKQRDEVIAAANEYSKASVERRIAYYNRMAAVAKAGTVGIGVVEFVADGLTEHGTAAKVGIEGMKLALEETELDNELKATELEIMVADKSRMDAYKKLEEAWLELQKCKGEDTLGHWNGTIKWHQTEQVSETTDTDSGTEQSQRNLTYVWNIQLIQDQPSQTVQWNSTDHSESHGTSGCLKTEKVIDTVGSASGQSKEGDVYAVVHVDPTGPYSIQFSTLTLDANIHQTLTQTDTSLGGDCVSSRNSETSDYIQSVGWSDQLVTGQVDPNYPDLLDGSETTEEPLGTTDTGPRTTMTIGTRTTTISWHLIRYT